eukprot:TRINITY_DN1222_c0_g1_i2.p3 TRINITY_DN1222_c0_g1~~TRINITY_DN1222_c0_g1_i2.p3  ORF type:complete len:216 (-),score=29.50 TRINITY_DN1222_c0_g1_i2:31-678(-)
MRLQPAFQRAEVESAALAGDFAAVQKNRQGRNAADIEAGGQLLFGFGIDLDQPGVGLEVDGGLMEVWCHLAAWATPWRPEIDDDRQVVAGKVTVEIGRSQFQRFAGEQWLLALAAVRRVAQFCGWNAIDRRAVRADEVQAFGHLRLQISGPMYSALIPCLLYTSDAADDMQCVDLGGRRIIKKKKKKKKKTKKKIKNKENQQETTRWRSHKTYQN